MKKRVLSLLLVLLMVMSLVPMSALADRSNTDVAYAVEGGNIYFNKSMGTITDCDRYVTKAIIPDKIDGAAVTHIGYQAFYYCVSLASIVIPNSVTSIGNSAFIGCTSLASIDIPDKAHDHRLGCIRRLHEPCEYRYPGQRDDHRQLCIPWLHEPCEHDIPNSVTSISYGAFDGCTSLADVYYAGDAAQWNAIKIEPSNEPLTGATIHYGVEHTHSYTAAVTAPTCTEQGYTTYTCSCGDSYKGSYVDPLGHNYKNGTCTRCGVKDPNYKPQADFTDVAAGSYCYDAVQWAVANGITNGTDATHFSPNASCTRGQVVTFLWRAAGEPVVSGNVGFVDVAPGSYCYEAVKWAVANGITKGTDATHFSPNATCTRGQVVTFMYRAADEPTVGGSNGFVDVAAGSYCYNAVQWAVANGITKGTDATHFSPNATCTRGQVVTFLYRAQ